MAKCNSIQNAYDNISINVPQCFLYFQEKSQIRSIEVRRIFIVAAESMNACHSQTFHVGLFCSSSLESKLTLVSCGVKQEVQHVYNSNQRGNSFCLRAVKHCLSICQYNSSSSLRVFLSHSVFTNTIFYNDMICNMFMYYLLTHVMST